MFLLDDIKQSRVYQAAIEEGEMKLVLRLLTKKFGNLSKFYIQGINNLAISQLEDLAEALLDFENISDLDRWLEQ